MTHVPTGIRSLKDQQVLELTWPDGRVDSITFKSLRCACPCAGCVDEFTGEIRLDPETIPADISPTEISFSGNYALKITWSDRHNTGLFSWEFLHREGALLARGA